MNDCFCDYEMPILFVERHPIAKKTHKCCECGGNIKPGEKYYRATGVWDGELSSFKICPDCEGLLNYTQLHIPCLCFGFCYVIENCINAIKEYPDIPGLLFGAYRFVAKSKRRKFL